MARELTQDAKHDEAFRHLERAPNILGQSQPRWHLSCVAPPNALHNAGGAWELTATNPG
jgi:hypothetical protein